MLLSLKLDRVDHQEGGDEREDGVGFDHDRHHDGLALHFGALTGEQHARGGHARLLDGGIVADDGDGQAGDDIGNALLEGDGQHRAGDRLRVNQDEHADEQAVNALRGGKKLQNEQFARYIRVFRGDARARYAREAYAAAGADTREYATSQYILSKLFS